MSKPPGPGYVRLVNDWKYSNYKLPKHIWKRFGRYARRCYSAVIDGRTIWFPVSAWNDGDGYGTTDGIYNTSDSSDWCLDVLEAWLAAENIVLDGKKYYFRS